MADKPTATPKKKWWDVRSWSNKKRVLSAGAIITAALAIFGTYQGMVARAKSNIKSELDAAVAGKKQFQMPDSKATLANYQNAAPQERKKIINDIVAGMRLDDIAFKAIFGNSLP